MSTLTERIKIGLDSNKTEMCATTQQCMCGYARKGGSNWSKHRKGCRVLKAALPLQDEVERLRTLHADAVESAEAQRDAIVRALEERMNNMADEQAQLQQKVAAVEAKIQSIVPTQTTNNTFNNTMHVHLYGYEQTPLPKMKELLELLSDPPTAVPNFFARKHLTDPKTRNVKITDGQGARMSIYRKDESGVCKWQEGDRKKMLTKVVSRIIDDISRYQSPSDKRWVQWRRYCSEMGINWQEPG